MYKQKFSTKIIIHTYKYFIITLDNIGDFMTDIVKLYKFMDGI